VPAGVLDDLEIDEVAVLVKRGEELQVPRVGPDQAATGHLELPLEAGPDHRLRARDDLDDLASDIVGRDRPLAVGECQLLAERNRDPVSVSWPFDEHVSHLDGHARATEIWIDERIVAPLVEPGRRGRGHWYGK
jgi:hypothetical protein